jgi:hypothetical protein
MTAPSGVETYTAVVSDDGLYRYHLSRSWADGPRALFVAINPSVANADVNDPSVVRMIGFGRREGFGGIEIVNAYAIIHTDIRMARLHRSPIGPDNDVAIITAALRVTNAGGKIIVAWGAKPWAADRLRVVRRILQPYPLWCLGVNKDGSPRHPLMLAGDTPLVRWPVAA